MRLLPVVSVAFCLGSILIFFSAIGVFGIFDGQQVGSEPIEGSVEEQEAQAENASVDPEESTGFFSFIGSAISTIGSFGSMLAYLPTTLEGLGFPEPFADLVGRGIQIVIVIGIVQMAIQWEVR